MTNANEVAIILMYNKNRNLNYKIYISSKKASSFFRLFGRANSKFKPKSNELKVGKNIGVEGEFKNGGWKREELYFYRSNAFISADENIQQISHFPGSYLSNKINLVGDVTKTGGHFYSPTKNEKFHLCMRNEESNPSQQSKRINLELTISQKS